MKQVMIKKGRAEIEEVPCPMVAPGAVLVAVERSCISAGTELSGVKATGQPLWKRAVKNPKAVKRVLQLAATQGIGRTKNMVQNVLEAGYPTGYSATGRVLEVGEGIDDICIGDRVAVAGAQFANHAQVVCVPRNLTVHVPEGLDPESASTVTLGAIALQGVRRATPTMGETFVVIGLGLLGQLAVQLLKANGCRVIGVDLDSTRIAQAEALGLDAGVYPEDGADIKQVVRMTDGHGADGVIVTAATPSDEVMATAFQMCRRKGRVVLVGDVGLNINRADIYAKELDFFISTSYGPGRYDDEYELHGLDYPIGYVRWTENRNMAEYLRLLAEKRVQVKPMIESVHAIDDAAAAYASLNPPYGQPRPLMTLLSYPNWNDDEPDRHTIINPKAQPSSTESIKLGVIGAGSFAVSMHLPIIRKMQPTVAIQAIVNRTGHKAQTIAQQNGAAYATTDVEKVFNDNDVDAVLITTRHDTHANLVLRALESGKHVLVEKPLALNEEELSAIETFYSTGDGEKPVLLTGFNRRFSPFALRAREIVSRRTSPMIINYRMNAGHIPSDHWVHGPEGGGRNVGEACHIYDLFTSLTDSRIEDVTARSIRPSGQHYRADDNFVATLRFDDGSIATLTYTSLGTNEHPKELMDVYADGKVICLHDYKELIVTGAKADGLATQLVDKGHQFEVESFFDVIRTGGDWPIPLWHQLQAMRIAFQIECLT